MLLLWVCLCPIRAESSPSKRSWSGRIIKYNLFDLTCLINPMRSWLVTLLAGLAEKSIFMSGFGFFRGKAPCKGSELQGWFASPCTCSQLATRNVSTMMLRGDQRSYNLCESQGRKRKVIGAGWEPGVPWEELHLSWALPVPQFPFTLLLSGQHAGVDVAAPRSLQVQGGGNISGRKNS